MKETGIVRRVDDLGRVAIPKEIRRTLRIREGDDLELYLDNGMICLKKYCANESFAGVIDGLMRDIERHIDDPFYDPAVESCEQALEFLSKAKAVLN